MFVHVNLLCSFYVMHSIPLLDHIILYLSMPLLMGNYIVIPNNTVLVFLWICMRIESITAMLLDMHSFNLISH